MLHQNPLSHTVALATALAAFAPSARADAVTDFYKGKELRLVISTTVGTGYDAYARAMGRHRTDDLPLRCVVGGVCVASTEWSAQPSARQVFRSAGTASAP